MPVVFKFIYFTNNRPPYKVTGHVILQHWVLEWTSGSLAPNQNIFSPTVWEPKSNDKKVCKTRTSAFFLNNKIENAYPYLKGEWSSLHSQNSFPYIKVVCEKQCVLLLWKKELNLSQHLLLWVLFLCSLFPSFMWDGKSGIKRAWFVRGPGQMRGQAQPVRWSGTWRASPVFSFWEANTGWKQIS